MSIKRITICLSLPLCFTAVYANEVETLPKVHVEGQMPVTTTPLLESVRQALSLTPGGVNLIDSAENTGSKHTLRDLLDYQPGITLLDFFGGTDQPVLTIRGSGIQSHPLSRGVMLLENGLPLNEADGSFIIGMLESRDADIVAARRGANAMNPASDTLGGELDFNNMTGRKETGSVSVQHGSFDTSVARAAFGRANDRVDYHVSVSGSRSDGFRDHSDQRRHAFRANIGVAINENFENRTWLSYTDQKFQIPGPLTLKAVYSDPSSNTNNTMPMVSVTDPHRETSQWRIANKSIIRAGDFTHDFGFYLQRMDDLFASPTTYKDSDIDTLGAQYKLEAVRERLTYGAALSWANSSIDLRYRGNPNNPMAPIRRMTPVNYDVSAQYMSAQLHANWQFADEWRALGQLRFVHTKRDISQKNGTAQYEDSWNWLAPKLGVIWSPSKDHMFFANVSTSREAPTVDQMIQFRSPPPSARMEIVGMEPQKAITYEIGGRGRFTGLFGWDMSLYRSEIKKELIEYSPNGINIYTYNYDGKTRHQGIELGLTGDWNLPANYGGLHGRLSYTLNDFKFREGDYAGNRIAGVPRNMLSASLKHEIGPWQFGINSRTAIGNTPTDHSNRIFYGGYTIFGASVNYQVNRDAYFFLQADNLMNKRYVASSSTPATASPTGPYYFPGNGRAVMVGFNANF